MKKIWLTSFKSTDRELLRQTYNHLKNYVNIDGFICDYDIDIITWNTIKEGLIDKEISLWAVIMNSEDLNNFLFNYNISTLILAVQQKKGLNFPIIFIQTDHKKISKDHLPTPFLGIEIIKLSVTDPSAKILYKINSSSKKIKTDYYIDVYQIPHIGQWFEIGPINNIWKSGSLMGVCGAQILFQGVGSRGSLPKKSKLKSPIEGAEITWANEKFIIWSVQNEITPKDSHFLKIEGRPHTTIFGPTTNENEIDMYVIKLK